MQGSDQLPSTSADRVSMMSRVRHQVRGEQQRWKGAVQEQRRHIYDHHTMLNWPLSQAEITSWLHFRLFIVLDVLYCHAAVGFSSVEDILLYLIMEERLRLMFCLRSLVQPVLKTHFATRDDNTLNQWCNLLSLTVYWIINVISGDHLSEVLLIIHGFCVYFRTGRFPWSRVLWCQSIVPAH